METKETEVLSVEGLQELFEKQTHQVEAKLSDWDKHVKASYRIDNGPEKAAIVTMPKPVETAEMSDVLGINLNKIDFKSIAVGGVISIFATELVDGALARQNVYIRAGAKVAFAVIAGKYLGKMKIVGADGAKVIMTLMVFDALRDVIPIENTVKQWTGQVTGMVSNRGLAGPGKFAAVPKGYYGSAFGR
jgi:hypothetical protein